MGLPTLVRTWQFLTNVAIGPTASITENSQRIIWNWKEALIGNGSWTDSTGAATASAGNWVVQSSSDGAGSFGASDLWVAYINLIWNTAGSNHSWIVLKQTGILSNFQLCIDLSNAASQGNSGTVVVSANAGFSGGTATARPTAADEQIIVNNASFGPHATTTANHIHFMKTSDGSAFRALFARNGHVGWGYCFEKPVNTVTGWTYPYVVLANGSNTATPTSSIFSLGNFFNTQANGFGRGVSNMNLAVTSEGTNSGPISTIETVPNDLDGTNPMVPMGVFSTTASNIGRHGTLVDMWWGLTTIGDTSTYPATGTLHQFVQIANFIFPWNQIVGLWT